MAGESCHYQVAVSHHSSSGCGSGRGIVSEIPLCDLGSTKGAALRRSSRFLHTFNLLSLFWGRSCWIYPAHVDSLQGLDAVMRRKVELWVESNTNRNQQPDKHNSVLFPQSRRNEPKDSTWPPAPCPVWTGDRQRVT